ncbi:uroplakin-3b [Lissotriton helveticus]
MALPLPLLSLLLAVVAVHGLTAPEVYQPQITAKLYGGNITATTFALDTPTCVFNESATNTIYLLVSYNNATTTVPFGTITRTTAGTMSYSKLATQGYYITLNTTGINYKCPGPNDNLSVLRIGNDASCGQDPSAAFCNGPLPPGASLRVIFIMFDINGAQTRTRWSEVINLISVKAPSTIDTWIGRRSGGMIVITTILSVLLAILLACLIAALAVGTKDICWRKKLDNKPYEDVDIDKLKRYTFHHAPETPQYRI